MTLQSRQAFPLYTVISSQSLNFSLRLLHSSHSFFCHFSFEQLSLTPQMSQGQSAPLPPVWTSKRHKVSGGHQEAVGCVQEEATDFSPRRSALLETQTWSDHTTMSNTAWYLRSHSVGSEIESEKSFLDYEAGPAA